MIQIYTLFVLALVLCRRPCLPARAFIPLFILTGWLTESLAWASSVVAGEATPITFHPQLGVDLTLSIGFYGALGLGWWLLARRFAYRLREIFVMAGIWGIAFEQNGVVLAGMVQALPLDPAGALLQGLYVFAVYGAFSALPFMLAGPLPGRSRHWLRLPLALLAMVVLPFLGTALVIGIWELWGGVPAPRSALEHPFW